MASVATLRRSGRLWWLPTLSFLAANRALVTLAALAGATWFPPSALPDIPGLDPRALPGVWVRWDSGYYLTIAAAGYGPRSPELAFLPAYPLALRLASLGRSEWMPWAGVIVSGVAFAAAGLVLWRLVAAQLGRPAAGATVAALGLFPTSFFYSAVYTESLFLLLSTLTYWCAWRRRYTLAALLVGLASLTRVTGILLAIIPLYAAWRDARPGALARALVVAGVSATGPAGYGLYLWVTQGSPLAFAQAQANWLRHLAWPWSTIADSLRVALAGYGGSADNWLMRVTSGADLLAALLLIACAALSFRLLDRGLALFTLATVLVLLASHGPHTFGLWSMSRFALGVFPALVVLGTVVSRLGRLKWGLGALSLALLLFLSGWFATGRWVA